MLQQYNCQTNKVSYISKIPLNGWITKYNYRTRNQKLIVDLETADDFMNYVFDSNLRIESEAKDKKLNITQDKIRFNPEYVSTLPTDYLKLILNLMTSSFTYLKKRFY